jgi:ABC-type maltose transport system permease subunit
MRENDRLQQHYKVSERSDCQAASGLGAYHNQGQGVAESGLTVWLKPAKENALLTAEIVILTLKVAVIAVTLLLLASLTALAFGRYRLHGRINLVFFVLVLAALLGFELVAQVVYPGMLRNFLENEGKLEVFFIHLGFSIPSTLLLPVMLWTGLKGRGRLHVTLGVLFLAFWTGTFVTGVFYLPPYALR